MRNADIHKVPEYVGWINQRNICQVSWTIVKIWICPEGNPNLTQKRWLVQPTHVGIWWISVFQISLYWNDCRTACRMMQSVQSFQFPNWMSHPCFKLLLLLVRQIFAAHNDNCGGCSALNWCSLNFMREMGISWKQVAVAKFGFTKKVNKQVCIFCWCSDEHDGAGAGTNCGVWAAVPPTDQGCLVTSDGARAVREKRGRIDETVVNQPLSMIPSRLILPIMLIYYHFIDLLKSYRAKTTRP